MSDMMDDKELARLGRTKAPQPSRAARDKALAAAMRAFDGETVAVSQPAPQGNPARRRLSDIAMSFWRTLMSRKSVAAPAIAGLLVLPLAGYAAFHFMETSPLTLKRETAAPQPAASGAPTADLQTALPAPPSAAQESLDARPAPEPTQPALARRMAEERAVRMRTMLPQSAAPQSALPKSALPQSAVPQSAVPMGGGMANDMAVARAADNERLTEFDSNPVKAVVESPVSTFSIDVDTASYSLVRRSLRDGVLPQPDTVRVEEMVNYFPYDWKGPDSAATPFAADVSVMPTPWNAGTKLMHIAIKGYELPQAERPRANLVFLIDVSGSMNAPDKLPLLKSSFRLLVNRMGAQDTVSIVTYAGNAGVVLEPTSDKAKILAAIDNLDPGGSTAGEAGLREAYRLAGQSFVRGGVNRVMLATDGDFNVGQTDDDDLKRLIQKERDSGVFLSVLGFGRGNLNDRMMQELAQNGNGQAAYIDTLAEAEKTLVEEAGSTLFPIAKDVKIQVEFNPRTIAEYRLIGYETRALNREDFNDDTVDAGEIGSGHSVTAIYEITPKGSAVRRIDDLRYGQARGDNPAGVANGDEYAFVKIRYKKPAEDESRLIETPVGEANEIGGFDRASDDQRFSVAVAAFGQKLRGNGELAAMDSERIAEIAAAARGSDPYGYRSEFLSLVRLAASLSRGR